jgi:TetR/AcrR family transcriptional repressor of nem operon
MTATGLQKGGIYRHFKSKEELAVAAFDHAWETAWRIRWTDVDRTSNATNQLKQFVRNFIEKRAELVRGGCPVLNTAIDSDDGNPVLREHARKALAQWTKRIRGIVKTGLLKGDIRKDVDPQMVATVVISTLEGALMMVRIQPADPTLKLVCEHLEGYIDGLK